MSGPLNEAGERWDDDYGLDPRATATPQLSEAEVEQREEQLKMIRYRAENYLTGTVHAETYNQDVNLLLSMVDGKVADYTRPRAADPQPPLCAVHAALDRKDTLVLEVGNGCIACSLHERTQLLNLLEPFAANDGSQDSLTVLRSIINSAAPSVTAPVSTAEQDGWVTFGRVKVDIENETETFERIYPPTAATSEAIRAAAYDVVGLELLRVDRVEEILSRYFGKGETDAGFVEVFRDTAIKCHFGYRHEGPWDTCEWIECEDRRMLIQSFTAAPGSPSPAEPLLSDDDAALTAHAIRVARAVQEFIWADCYPSLRPYDAEGWRQLFQKRVDCIAGVDLSRHGGLPVLRKRLLQQAALSIKALALVNRWAKSRATASLDGTDLKQTAALRTSVGAEAAANEQCAWTLDDSNDGDVWETGCGETFQFNEGGPSDNKFIFCYKCGKRIDPGKYSDSAEGNQINDLRHL